MNTELVMIGVQSVD